MAGYTERDMKMADYVKVAVDAMGGDNAPGEIVKGAVDAVCAEKKIKVFLVGKEEQVKAELSRLHKGRPVTDKAHLRNLSILYKYTRHACKNQANCPFGVSLPNDN